MTWTEPGPTGALPPTLPPTRVPYQSGPTWEIIAPGQVKPEMRAYRPYGAIEQMMYCHDPEVVIDGPAGTGKSLGILHKLHICCLKYPGIRVQIARKFR